MAAAIVDNWNSVHVVDHGTDKCMSAWTCCQSLTVRNQTSSVAHLPVHKAHSKTPVVCAFCLSHISRALNWRYRHSSTPHCTIFNSRSRHRRSLQPNFHIIDKEKTFFVDLHFLWCQIKFSAHENFECGPTHITFVVKVSDVGLFVVSQFFSQSARGEGTEKRRRMGFFIFDALSNKHKEIKIEEGMHKKWTPLHVELFYVLVVNLKSKTALQIC